MPGREPQDWIYSALLGMSLLLAGWLWQVTQGLQEELHRLRDVKADKTAADDRWTGNQQKEYRLYVEARLAELNNRQVECAKRIEKEHGK